MSSSSGPVPWGELSLSAAEDGAILGLFITLPTLHVGGKAGIRAPAMPYCAAIPPHALLLAALGGAAGPAQAPLGKHGQQELISHGQPSICHLMSPAATAACDAQPGTAWHRMARFGTAWRSLVPWPGPAQYGLVEPGTD